MARCREHKQGETFKTHQPLKKKKPSSAQKRSKENEIKKHTQNIIYTACTRFRDLNTNIHLSTEQFPTYSVPLD